MKPVVVAPSILAADLRRLGEEVRAVDQAGSRLDTHRHHGWQVRAELLPKIGELRRICESKGLDPWVEVDGGQSGDNAALAIEAGADAGAAIFGSDDYVAAISRIRNGTLRKVVTS